MKIKVQTKRPTKASFGSGGLKIHKTKVGKTITNHGFGVGSGYHGIGVNRV